MAGRVQRACGGRELFVGSISPTRFARKVLVLVACFVYEAVRFDFTGSGLFLVTHFSAFHLALDECA